MLNQKFISSLCVFTLFLAACPQAWADCRVYEFRCMPDFEEVQINTFERKCDDVEPAYKQKQLAQRGLYPVDMDGKTYECRINDQNVKVKIDGFWYRYDTYGSNCANKYTHATRLNAWVNDHQIIEDLRFRPGCTKDKGTLGGMETSFERVRIGAWPYSGGPYPIATVGLIEFGEEKKHYIKLAPPYADYKEYPGPVGQPLNSRYVHGDAVEDAFKVIPPPPMPAE